MGVLTPKFTKKRAGSALVLLIIATAAVTLSGDATVGYWTGLLIGFAVVAAAGLAVGLAQRKRASGRPDSM